VVAAAAVGEPYNLVVNLGIAGSYDLEAFPIGSAAVISREHFADLGFGSEEGFSDLFQYGILEKDDFPYTKGALARQLLPYPHIEKVLEKYGAGAGATVQCVTGTQARCNEIVAMYNPQIESMEGAGVYYAALMEKVPFFELRTVSNAVGERDTSKWESKAALDTLEECCREIFSVI
jgi:futalosine hydrolase